MTKPKPIRERAWVRLLPDGSYYRSVVDGALTLHADGRINGTPIEVEIRSLPQPRSRKRRRGRP